MSRAGPNEFGAWPMMPRRHPGPMRAALLLFAALVAGCAGEPPAPAVSPMAAPTPSATPPAPTSEATPRIEPQAPTPPVPIPTPEAVASPVPDAANVSGSDYVEPAFAAQDKIADAADPGAFADVNPFEYQNPWRD